MSAKSIIKKFGGLTKTARALGHKHVTTVQGWNTADRIPIWRRYEVLAAVERKGISLTKAEDSYLRTTSIIDVSEGAA